MRWGAKSLTALTLLASSVGVAAYFGRLRSDYLAQLDPWASFVIGAFAVLSGSAVFHFARLGVPSEHHLVIDASGRPGVQRSDPFSRAPSRESWSRRWFRHALMRTSYTAVFLLIGLVTIDNRGVALLTALDQLFEPPSHAFCLDAPEPEPEDPLLAGCSLLRRAYALGYAKDLGPCAPKEEEVVTDACDRRQLDEPYLHYAWRLLVSRPSGLLDAPTQRVAPAEVVEWKHLVALARTQQDAIVNTPRASHHLFTNLPPPRPGAVRQVVEAIDVAACERRSVNMPHLLNAAPHPQAPSLVFEHALGQLLFNPAYPMVVASCREHIIHWNAPPDACEQLVEAPQGPVGAAVLAKVRVTIDRHRRSVVTWRLANRLGRTPRPPRPPRLSRVVSFQCLMVDEGLSKSRTGVTETAVTVDGHTFSVRSMRVAPGGAAVRDQIRQFDNLSRLLAPGFAYGSLQSQQSLAEVDERAVARRFAETSDLLTTLELLRETDIFLGHAWMDERPDLLAVYPYHVHLKNFVESFRRHYQHTRSRL